jgi:predicted hydrocarbon binding protein
MAIDRNTIIEKMSKIDVTGNEEGLIPILGVYVQQLPTDFWNEFSALMVNGIDPDLVGAVETMLERAAHECGYYTGYGIITSDEWKAVVEPMIEKSPEDVLHGAFAIFTAWGWADSEIVELVPGEKMVVRAYDYYEADGAKKADIKRPFAHMIRGVSAAFMDLAYGEPFPNGMDTYACEQTKGIEIGDEYGEFVVTKK